MGAVADRYYSAEARTGGGVMGGLELLCGFAFFFSACALICEW